MLHVRKHFSKKETEEWKRWIDGHRASIKELSPAEKAKSEKLYWEKQALEANSRRQTAHLPSAPFTPDPPVRNPLAELDLEAREEYLRREAAAQRLIEEKKLRTAPAYNKGGAVYWTEEMAKDLQTGGHWRR